MAEKKKNPFAKVAEQVKKAAVQAQAAAQSGNKTATSVKTTASSGAAPAISTSHGLSETLRTAADKVKQAKAQTQKTSPFAKYSAPAVSTTKQQERGLSVFGSVTPFGGSKQAGAISEPLVNIKRPEMSKQMRAAATKLSDIKADDAPRYFANHKDMISRGGDYSDDVKSYIRKGIEADTKKGFYGAEYMFTGSKTAGDGSWRTSTYRYKDADGNERETESIYESKSVLANYLTETDKANYYYILGRYGEYEARRYLDEIDIMSLADPAEEAYSQKRYKGFAERHPVAERLLRVPMGFAGAVEGAYNKMGHVLGSDTSNLSTSEFKPSTAVSGAKAGFTAAENEWIDKNVGNKVGNTILKGGNAGVNMALDTLWLAPLGAAGKAAEGTAYASKILKGVHDMSLVAQMYNDEIGNQVAAGTYGKQGSEASATLKSGLMALSYGFISRGASGFLGKLAPGATGLKKFIMNETSATLSGGGAAATQHVLGEIADTVIRGDYSDYEQAVKAYISSGMSEAEARSKAAHEIFVKGTVDALITGGLVSALYAIPHSYADAVRFDKCGRDVRASGRDVMTEAFNQDPNSPAYKNAERLSKKYSGNEKGLSTKTSPFGTWDVSKMTDGEIGAQAYLNDMELARVVNYRSRMNDILGTVFREGEVRDERGRPSNAMINIRTGEAVRDPQSKNPEILDYKHEVAGHRAFALAPETKTRLAEALAGENLERAIQRRMEALGLSREDAQEEVFSDLAYTLPTTKDAIDRVTKLVETDKTMAFGLHHTIQSLLARVKDIGGAVTTPSGDTLTHKKLAIANRIMEEGIAAAAQAYKAGVVPGSGVKYSTAPIKGNNGDYGVGVYLDTNIFDGIKPRNWNKKLSEFVYNNLAGADIEVFDSNGTSAIISFAKENERVAKDGAKNNHRVIDKLARAKGNTNMLSIVHIDELLRTAEYLAETSENSHQWLDKNGWELRKAYVQDRNGNIFETTLNISKTSDGRNILYALSNTKKIDEGDVPSARNAGGARTLSTDLLDNSIPQPGGDVKKFSRSIPPAAEERMPEEVPQNLAAAVRENNYLAAERDVQEREFVESLPRINLRSIPEGAEQQYLAAERDIQERELAENVPRFIPKAQPEMSNNLSVDDETEATRRVVEDAVKNMPLPEEPPTSDDLKRQSEKKDRAVQRALAELTWEINRAYGYSPVRKINKKLKRKIVTDAGEIFRDKISKLENGDIELQDVFGTNKKGKPRKVVGSDGKSINLEGKLSEITDGLARAKIYTNYLARYAQEQAIEKNKVLITNQDPTSPLLKKRNSFSDYTTPRLDKMSAEEKQKYITQLMIENGVSRPSELAEDTPTRKDSRKSAFKQREGAETVRAKLYTSLVDDMHPFFLYNRTGERAAGGVKNYGKGNAYKLALNSKEAGARASYILLDQMVDYDNNFVGAGLADTLQSGGITDKNINDFNRYLVARHAAEWLDTENHGGYKAVYTDNALNHKDVALKMAEDFEAQYPEFRAASDSLYKWYDKFMQTWLVDTGCITQKQLDSMREKYPCYVPFLRETGKAKSARQSKRDGDVIKKAIGTPEYKVRDPIENIMYNVGAYVNYATRNGVKQAAVRLYDAFEGQEDNPLAEYWREVEPADSELKDMHTVFRPKGAESEGDIDKPDGAKGITDTLHDAMNVRNGNIVTVMFEGKPRYFEVQDQEFLRAIENLNPVKMDGLLGLLGGLSRARAALLTSYKPTFAFVTNPIRDVGTYVLNTEDKNKARAIAGWVNSYADMAWHSYESKNAAGALARAEKYAATHELTEDEQTALEELRSKAEGVIGDADTSLYEQYKAAGGEGSGQFESSSDKIRKAISKSGYGTDDTRLKRALSKIGLSQKNAGVKIAKKIFDGYGSLADAIEAGPRKAEFKRTLNEGHDYHEALFRAKDVTTNFSRGGKIVKQLNAVSNFFNASVQGVDKYFRHAKNNPASFLIGTGVLAILSLASWAWNHYAAKILGEDDDELKEAKENLSNYTKNNFYYFYIGDGKFFTLNKPRESAAIVTGIEAVMDRVLDGEDDRFKGFFSEYLLNQFLPDGNIFAVSTYTDLMANKDYRGMDIIPSELEDMPRELQYDDNTSYLSKWAAQPFGTQQQIGFLRAIGDFFDISPKKLDYIINNEFGVLGTINKTFFTPSTFPGKTGEVTTSQWTMGLSDNFFKDSRFSQDKVSFFYDNKRAAEVQNKGYPTADNQYLYSRYSQSANVMTVINGLYKSDPNAFGAAEIKRQYVNFAKANKDKPAGYSDEVYTELKKLYDTDDSIVNLPSIPKQLDRTVNGEKEIYQFHSVDAAKNYREDINKAVEAVYRELFNDLDFAAMGANEKVGALKKAQSAAVGEVKNFYIDNKGKKRYKVDMPELTPPVAADVSARSEQMAAAENRSSEIADRVRPVISAVSDAAPDKDGYTEKSMTIDTDDFATVKVNDTSYNVKTGLRIRLSEAANQTYYDTITKLESGETDLITVCGTTSKGKAHTATGADGNKYTLSGKLDSISDPLVKAKIYKDYLVPYAKQQAIEQYKDEIMGAEEPPSVGSADSSPDGGAQVVGATTSESSGRSQGSGGTNPFAAAVRRQLSAKAGSNGNEGSGGAQLTAKSGGSSGSRSTRKSGGSRASGSRRSSRSTGGGSGTGGGAAATYAAASAATPRFVPRVSNVFPEPFGGVERAYPNPFELAAARRRSVYPNPFANA